MDTEAVRKQAEEEIYEEDFNAAVQAEKVRIRTHVPWYHTIFPWKVIVIRRTP